MERMELSERNLRKLRQNEESLLRPEVRFSRDKMDDLLDEDFFEFGASGQVYDKKQTLDVQPREIGEQLPLPDFSARLLVPSVALVTYRSVQVFSDGSRKEARRSSIRAKSGKNWRVVFHQGTLLQKS